MQVGSLKFVQGSNGFQSGYSSIPAGGFNLGQSAIGNFPGTNTPKNYTNQWGTMPFVALHYKGDREGMYKSHYQQLMLRYLPTDMAQGAEFFRWNEILASTALNTRSLAMYNLDTEPSRKRRRSERIANKNNNSHFNFTGSSPYCHIFTVPQANYYLANGQLEKGVVLKPIDIWKAWRPIGANITPEATQELYDCDLGDLREHKIGGPVHITNCFGNKKIEENDFIYLIVKAVPCGENAKVEFTLTNDQQEPKIVKMVPEIDGKANPNLTNQYYWQFQYYVNRTPPSYEEMFTTIGKERIKGTWYRIGRIQFTYVENECSVQGMLLKSQKQNQAPEQYQSAAGTSPLITIFFDSESPYI